MQEVEKSMEQLIQVLYRSKEYNQYQTLLGKIKEKEELFRRIGEYRRRTIYLQKSNTENLIQANNDLENEFRDLQNNVLVNEYLVAEHQYCKMIQKLQEQFLEAACIETGFLDE